MRDKPREARAARSGGAACAREGARSKQAARSASREKRWRRACKTWEIVLDTLGNAEAKAAEILQITEECNDHVARTAAVPDNITSWADWASRTTKLYQTLISLKSGLSQDEERLMARRVASKFVQHSIHGVSMYGNEAGHKTTGDLKVHEVVRQLGARFKEAQGTTKVVLAKKEAEDIKGIQGTLQELATATPGTVSARSATCPATSGGLVGSSTQRRQRTRRRRYLM